MVGAAMVQQMRMNKCPIMWPFIANCLDNNLNNLNNLIIKKNKVTK